MNCIKLVKKGHLFASRIGPLTSRHAALSSLRPAAAAVDQNDVPPTPRSPIPNTSATLEADWPRKPGPYDPAFQKIDLSFDNAQEAYRSKKTSELLRGYLVFQMCSIRYLVEHNKQLMKICRKILGKSLFEKLMKASFYGHFVAGEDAQRIRPLVEKNMKFGVKSILDYSVEMDLSREEARQAEYKAVGEERQASADDKTEVGPDIKFRAHYSFGDRREHVTEARTYFYKDEKMCDENMEHFLQGIDAVSSATGATGLAAIKITALGRPQLLLQLSEVLTRVRRYYEVLSQCYGTGTLSRRDFERHLRSFNMGRQERLKWFTILDCNDDGEIDLLDWHNLLEVNVSLAKLLRVPDLKTGQLTPVVTSLNPREEEQMKNMLRRIDTIIQHARERDVRVMIDAEQTYFQAAINRLCMEMMRTYNKEKAYVFNTYQCYLKDALKNITLDLALSRREDFYFGAKLVRGAYMDQERLRATTVGYEDPICPSFEATTKMYETVVNEVMQEIQTRERGKIAVMMASHNEDTVRYTIQKMQDYGICSTDRLICFGQLLGMCDQVSFSLGQAGYSVYKYVPYGPVEEVLPYLSRRALENKGVLTKVKKEKRLLRSELWRRLTRFQWFYTPQPPANITLNASAPSTNPTPPPKSDQAWGEENLNRVSK